MAILKRLAQQLQGKELRLVMPEGTDERVLRAARILRDRNLARIVLLGPLPDIEAVAADAQVSLSGISMCDPIASDALDSFARQYLQLRPKTKLSVARRLVSKPLFFGGSMLQAEQADAMVAGAASTTAKVIEASLMTVGLAEDVEPPSSCFLMLLPDSDDALIYADCAVTVAPNVEELASVAIASAETCRRLMSEEPRIAFLSFSTKGSGDHAMARKMKDAAALAAERAPDIAIDGELQADTALAERVAKLKLADPGPVAGRANVLIFPDLNAGNIAYKLTEQLAGARALGPILQGFSRPVSDLSRGASVDDIVDTAIITLSRAATNSLRARA